MANGIETGKLTDNEFRQKPHDEQHTLMFRGIEETQRIQNVILETLDGQEKKFIKKPKLLSLKTLFGAGVFVAGLIYALLEYL